MISHRLEVGPETMTWHDHGDRRALLLVHGFPLDHDVWQPQIRAFSTERRVLAPDLLGFGRSSSTGRATIAEHADDLARGLDSLSVDCAVIVGLSMGGYVTLSFWDRHPERCAALVLASTRAGADADDARAGRRSAAREVSESGMTALTDRLIPDLLGPGVPESVSRQVATIIARQPPDGVAAALEAMAARPSYEPLLETISVPTLVVVGERDASVFTTGSQRIAEAVDGCRLTVVPRAGHLANLEEPGAFNASLRDFLEMVDAG